MKITQTVIFLACVYGGADAQGCDGTEPEKWYSSGGSDWPSGFCKFERQCNGNYGAGFSTELACCQGHFGAQASGVCLSNLPAPPTTSPTISGGLAAFWYPDYDAAWPDAGCLNTLPLPFNNANDRPTYDTQLECCKGAYGGQSSGKCLSELASPPTTSPTIAGGIGDEWYPDYETAWSDAGCKAEIPVPSGRPTYATHLECCKTAYGGQTSGKCLSELASPPTTSPTNEGNTGSVFYPNYTQAWPNGVCTNQLPMPSGRPTYSNKNSCCSGAYGGQSSQACQCDANPCYSCKCGNAAFLSANGCSLTCS